MEFQFTRKNVDQLLQLSGQTVISIYLPTYKSGADQQQNPIRFSNLIKKAKDQLKKSDLSTHKLKVNLDEAAKAGEAEEPLWQYLKQGLAVFITESEVIWIKLPVAVEEFVQVGTHPYIKPLMPLITTNGKYYLLTLSQNDIKLYQANRTDIDKVYLGEEVPLSMEEHLEDVEVHKYLQHHSSSRGSKGEATFHGQGAGEETIKKDIEDFVAHIEKHITKLLEGDYSPLVIAGDDFLTAMYKKHNSYNELVEETISGNLEKGTKEKLHQDSWEIVRPIFKEKEEKGIDHYHEMAGTGKTSTQIEEVVKAAFDGKIQDLFVKRDEHLWGEYVEDKREVLIHDSRTAKSTDLLELATAQTLINSGNVYSLKEDEMIEGKTVAAAFRY